MDNYLQPQIAPPTSGSLNTTLVEKFKRVRGLSELIASPLSPEDCAIQSMPDVSPTRWHLAHTTWFFETFILKQQAEYQPFDESFEYLFNSYYNSVGRQFPRSQRGLISRPGLQQTLNYREYVDEWLVRLLEQEGAGVDASLVELGLQHEQQHQELMLTDIKHVLSINPLHPAYVERRTTQTPGGQPTAQWRSWGEQIVDIGYGESGFCFDNEMPRHRELVHPRALATQCVTNGQFLEFIRDGGYQRPELWLSMGWAEVTERNWSAPLYWSLDADDQYQMFCLDGLRPIELGAPVSHVSFFEADAYARWAGARLPTEFEWEAAAQEACQADPTWRSSGVFSDHLLGAGQVVHPRAPDATTGEHWMGNVWQWTASQYLPYPGYQPVPGALGEYNGKFMCNQFVLRGGSCATSSEHIRPTYRNFFPPEARWQFSGFRLAQNP